MNARGRNGVEQAGTRDENEGVSRVQQKTNTRLNTVHCDIKSGEESTKRSLYNY
jgi:hypothetical protein